MADAYCLYVTMIAAETPRLAIPTAAAPAPATSQSIFGRLAALLTHAAHVDADSHASADEGLWTSIARGF
jgi:hypothetical protein